MKTTKPKLNVRLLRKVQKYYKAEPLRLRMGWWFKKKKLNGQPNPPCRTTSCIAGTALILSGKKRIPAGGSRPMYEAAKLLRIENPDKMRALFLLPNWPYRFRKGFTEEGTSYWEKDVTTEQVLKNVKLTIARIDHFIETGE